jgi:ferredoxin
LGAQLDDEFWLQVVVRAMADLIEPGWSNEAARSGPKRAALLALAAEPLPPIPYVKLESGGVVLICGRDEIAVEAGNLLKDHLDVTVLIAPPAAIAPPRIMDFPVAKGKVRNASGHLGAFEVIVDDFAQAMPSPRGELMFGPSRDNARSSCDIIIDLTGGTALFPAADLRDGYLRADPGSSAAMLRAVLSARDLTGSFEKPRYIAYDDKLCAHSRSGIVGCTRCLELCPTSAITPAGDHVAIDANICAGCGQCAAACPTGAASYALPAEDVLMRKLRAMLMAYREAGGEQPIVLPMCCHLRSMKSHKSVWRASRPLSPTARRRCACCFGHDRDTTSPGCWEQWR